MSALKRGSYPHPVLDDSDDVSSTIEIFNVTVAPAVDDVELRFRLRMTDPGIRARIERGEARYSFRWKCGSTLSSEELEPQEAATYSDSKGYVAWIPQERIRRSVSVEVRIVALTYIAAYELPTQHPDYGGATFEVLPGDILADAGRFTFEADKLFDPLSPPIGSCFKFVEDPTLKRGVKVRWNNDEHVVVAFPALLHAGLAAFGARPDLQISLVVLPALMETIIFIRENGASADGEDLSDKLWHQAIMALIEAHGSIEDSVFELAQKILNNPLDISLVSPLTFEEDE